MTMVLILTRGKEKEKINAHHLILKQLPLKQVPRNQERFLKKTVTQRCNKPSSPRI